MLQNVPFFVRYCGRPSGSISPSLHYTINGTMDCLLTYRDKLVSDIYTEMYDAVRRYILRRIGDGRQADAEDLAQDTFVRLLTSDTEIDREQAPRLVYTIARNQVIDFLRHHASIRKAQEYFAGHAQRSSRVTDEQVAADELERIEADCIRKMPSKMAEVFVLYVHRGWSVPDISDSLEISRRTVENHIFRARRDVRQTVKMQYS